MVKLSLLIFLISADSLPKSELRESGNEIEKYTEWKLERQEEGIKVYTRWLTYNDELNVRQMKGELDLEKSTSEVASLILDEKLATQWMNRVKEYNRLKSFAPNEFIIYTLFNLPWPLNNQDLIAKYEVERKHGNVLVSIKGIADYNPEKKGIKRMPHFEGEWKLTALQNGKTRIEYTVHTKSKSKGPRWVTDPIIQNNFWSTLNNLQKMLEE